jgi:hypothetical protein
MDPYHPVILVLNCLESAPRYINTTDILMTDPYPIGLQQQVGCDFCKGRVTDVSHRVTQVIQEIQDSKVCSSSSLVALSGCNSRCGWFHRHLEEKNIGLENQLQENTEQCLIWVSFTEPKDFITSMHFLSL